MVLSGSALVYSDCFWLVFFNKFKKEKCEKDKNGKKTTTQSAIICCRSVPCFQIVLMNKQITSDWITSKICDSTLILHLPVIFCQKPDVFTTYHWLKFAITIASSIFYSTVFYPVTFERGTTDEFVPIPFHLDLFSAALVLELAKSISIHCLMYCLFKIAESG